MRRHDLVIIGTGSGNSIVDNRFADLDVAIVEEGTFGGTCLNVGCIPTKMFVHTADLARRPRGSPASASTPRRQGPLARHPRPDLRPDRPDRSGGEVTGRESPNVTVYREHARFTGTQAAAADRADARSPRTGSWSPPAAGPSIPDIPGLTTSGSHTSDTIMRIDDLPESMVILGGGVIAAEMAHVFSALGTAVTLVAEAPGC